MIYILYGNEEYLIKKKLNSIINENNDSEFIRFYGDDKDFNIDELIDSYCNVGLFAEKRLLVVSNPYFLNKKIDDNQINKIEQIANNQLYESTIVFYSIDGNINDKLKAFKILSDNSQVIKLNQLKRQDFYSECYSIIKEKKLNIDKSLINKIIDASNNSLTIFSQNIDVLSLYPETIDENVINGLLISNGEEDVFNLINALTRKNISLSIKYARKLLANDNNINGLLSLIGNQLRFLYEVSYYSNKGLSINEITDKTGSKNTYRIEKAFESLENFKDTEILKLLDNLANLDLNFKTNVDVDDNLQLELFIVNLLKNE